MKKIKEEEISKLYDELTGKILAKFEKVFKEEVPEAKFRVAPNFTTMHVGDNYATFWYAGGMDGKMHAVNFNFQAVGAIELGDAEKLAYVKALGTIAAKIGELNNELVGDEDLCKLVEVHEEKRSEFFA